MSEVLILDLPDISQIKSIPVYVLHASNARELPFLISLVMQDQQGQLIFPPSVTNAINRASDITGRTGLVIQPVVLGDFLEQVVQRSLFQTLALADAILFYHCQGTQVAENLIAQLLGMYRITLLKDFRSLSS
ncbi:MAG: hypothetical protein JHC61_03480 [Burkholderiaceae bacterium]|jgi:hypothetical protein|nr:hypothetical protein [Burkholderiaceae bacterium]